MGRTDASAGTRTPGFQSLLRLVGDGGCWVKLSGAHRLSQRAPSYEDARLFHEASGAGQSGAASVGQRLAASAHRKARMPDAGKLFELFHTWTPDDATHRRILVANPAKLYGFPD